MKLEDFIKLAIGLHEIFSGIYTISEIISFIYKGTFLKPKRCPICGKIIHFVPDGVHLLKEFPKTCGSGHCKGISSMKTRLSGTGFSNISQIPEISNKISKSMKTTFKKNNVSEKIRKTNLERYGTEFPIQRKDFSEKRRLTYINHFGTDHHMKSDEFKSGRTFKISDKTVREKSKKTMREKYASENFLSSENFKPVLERLTKEKLEKSYFKLLKVLGKTEISADFGLEKWKGYSSGKRNYLKRNNRKCDESELIYQWRCNKCGNRFSSPINSINQIPRCPKCSKLSSSFEENFIQFIEQNYSLKRIKLFRDNKIIPGVEIDVYFPELRIAFELNGNYWHSVKVQKNKNKHLNKTIECEKLGIRLFHVWESDWKLDETKKLILKILSGEKFPLPIDKEEISLDRSFPIFTIDQFTESGYEISKITPPEIMNKNGNLCFNCGFMIFNKNKINRP